MHYTRTRWLQLCWMMLLWPLLVFAQSPDRILYNGKVLTVDQKFSTAQAIAIRGERIVALGSDAAIRKLADSRTAQTDLKGAIYNRKIEYVLVAGPQTGKVIEDAVTASSSATEGPSFIEIDQAEGIGIGRAHV